MRRRPLYLAGSEENFTSSFERLSIFRMGFAWFTIAMFFEEWHADTRERPLQFSQTNPSVLRQVNTVGMSCQMLVISFSPSFVREWHVLEIPSSGGQCRTTGNVSFCAIASRSSAPMMMQLDRRRHPLLSSIRGARFLRGAEGAEAECAEAEGKQRLLL